MSQLPPTPEQLQQQIDRMKAGKPLDPENVRCMAPKGRRAQHCLGPSPVSQGYRCPFCWNIMNGHLKAASMKIDRARGEMQRDLSKGANVVALHSDWTIFVEELLTTLFYQDMEMLAPPTSFALCLCGSLARTEACPWSDIDCFMLVGNDDEASKNYFTGVSQNVNCHLKFGRPGQFSNKIPTNQKHILVGESPTGFQFCVSNLNPTNPQLVATPEHLIEAVQVLGGDDPHFMAVKTPRFVCGEFDLYRDFCRRLQALNAIGTRSAESALKEMELHVQSRQDLPGPGSYLVDIKVHIYRPLQGIVKALYSYYGFSGALETRAQLDALQKASHMSKEVNVWLKQAFDDIGRMRISGHLKTMSEEHAYFVRKLTAGERQNELRHAANPAVGYVGGIECKADQKRMIESLLTRVHTVMNLTETFIAEKRRERSFAAGLFKVNPFKTAQPDAASRGPFRFV